MATEQGSDTVLRLLGEVEQSLDPSGRFAKEAEEFAKLMGRLITALDDVFDPVSGVEDRAQKRRAFTALSNYTRKFLNQANDMFDKKIPNSTLTIQLSHVLYVLADYMDGDEKKLRELGRRLLIYSMDHPMRG